MPTIGPVDAVFRVIVKDDGTLALQKFEGEITNLGGGFSKLEAGIVTANAALGLVGQAVGVAKAGFKLLTEEVENLSKSLLGVSNNFYKFQQSLTGALGSSVAARQMAEIATQISAISPLTQQQVEGLVRSSVVNPSMRPMFRGGGQQTQENMQRVTDIITALGTLNPQQGPEGAAFAMREALGGQFLSLVRRFDLNVSAIEAASGKSINEIKRSSKDILDALEKFTTQAVGSETLRAMSMSPDVLIQGIKEQFEIIARRTNDARLTKEGEFAGIRGGIQIEGGTFEKFQGTLKDIFDEIYSFAQSGGEYEQKFKEKFTKINSSVVEELTRGYDAMKEFIKGLGGGESFFEGLFNLKLMKSKMAAGALGYTMDIAEILAPFGKAIRTQIELATGEFGRQSKGTSLGQLIGDTVKGSIVTIVTAVGTITYILAEISRAVTVGLTVIKDLSGVVIRWATWGKVEGMSGEDAWKDIEAAVKAWSDDSTKAQLAFGQAVKESFTRFGQQILDRDKVKPTNPLDVQLPAFMDFLERASAFSKGSLSGGGEFLRGQSESSRTSLQKLAGYNYSTDQNLNDIEQAQQGLAEEISAISENVHGISTSWADFLEKQQPDIERLKKAYTDKALADFASMRNIDVSKIGEKERAAITGRVDNLFKLLDDVEGSINKYSSQAKQNYTNFATSQFFGLESQSENAGFSVLQRVNAAQGFRALLPQLFEQGGGVGGGDKFTASVQNRQSIMDQLQNIDASLTSGRALSPEMTINALKQKVSIIKDIRNELEKAGEATKEERQAFEEFLDGIETQIKKLKRERKLDLGIADNLQDGFVSAVSSFHTFGEDMFQLSSDMATNMRDGFADIFVDGMKNSFDNVGQLFDQMANKMMNTMINTAAEMMANQTMSWLMGGLMGGGGMGGGMGGLFGGKGGGFLSNLFGFGIKPLPLASGGYISSGRGVGIDDVPATLGRGEYVMNARAVSGYGRGFFDALNSGALPKELSRGFSPKAMVAKTAFATGGVVDSSAKSKGDKAPVELTQIITNDPAQAERMIRQNPDAILSVLQSHARRAKLALGV